MQVEQIEKNSWAYLIRHMFLFIHYNLYFLTLMLTITVNCFKDNKYNCIYKSPDQKGK